jgi:Fe-S cluster biogenesis protein NfuA
MLSIICDSCKKAIPGPERQTGVVYILDRALCKGCESKLRTHVSEEMLKHRIYKFSDYKDTYIKTMQKMCR